MQSEPMQRDPDPMMDAVWTHGWFSEMQVKLNGHSGTDVALFERHDGERVQVTVTTSDRAFTNGPHFDDLVYVGLVGKYLGMCPCRPKKEKSPFYFLEPEIGVRDTP